MDKQREAFEAWQADTGRTDPMYLVYDENQGRYGLNALQDEWEIWQAAQQAQWLPIETAPRDGSVIILYNAGDVAAGWWHPHIYNGVAYDWCFIEDVEIDDDQRVVPNAWLKTHPPTHWMPLPPEPQQ